MLEHAPSSRLAMRAPRRRGRSIIVGRQLTSVPTGFALSYNNTATYPHMQGSYLLQYRMNNALIPYTDPNGGPFGLALRDVRAERLRYALSPSPTHTARRARRASAARRSCASRTRWQATARAPLTSSAARTPKPRHDVSDGDARRRGRPMRGQRFAPRALEGSPIAQGNPGVRGLHACPLHLDLEESGSNQASRHPG